VLNRCGHWGVNTCVRTCSFSYVELYWLTGPIRRHDPDRSDASRLSATLVTLLSHSLVALGKFIPKEFAQKPRPVASMDRWKTTEFRTFFSSLCRSRCFAWHSSRERVYKHCYCYRRESRSRVVHSTVYPPVCLINLLTFLLTSICSVPWGGYLLYNLFVQLCSWQDFDWHSASHGPSAIADFLVYFMFIFH